MLYVVDFLVLSTFLQCNPDIRELSGLGKKSLISGFGLQYPGYTVQRMPINKNQIFRVLIDICEEAEIYVTAKESTKGALITGATAFVGGLLMGPPGLAVGGTVGGLLAYRNSGNFRPVSKVFMELPEKKKGYLIENFSSIVSHLKATDAIMLLAIIRADQAVYQTIIEFIKDFIMSDLNMGIKS